MFLTALRTKSELLLSAIANNSEWCVLRNNRDRNMCTDHDIVPSVD